MYPIVSRKRRIFVKQSIQIAGCLILMIGASACSDNAESRKSDALQQEQRDAAYEKRYDSLLHHNASVPSSITAKGAAGARNEVVFFGDSMTAGYGVRSNQAFPHLIDEFWKKNGINLKAVNAGVSGDTTADLSFRLDKALNGKTIAAFVSIGSNDYFRRTPVPYVRHYYEEILTKLQAAGIEVILGDASFPRFFPGYEEKYTAEYNAMLPSLAEKFKCRVLPSIHAPVFMAGAFLPDKMHPNSHGHELLASSVLKFMNSEWKYNIR